ncbi:MAG: RHS repeat-associated core domain-containing protein [Thiotrichaceae bacterium]|nr:RHS repeat-associated core domain-containing protein [Thiotrichaceae bacterium]
MTSANMADGTHITYSYDALGNRRAKTVNGETTHYLTAPIFGMSHVLAELAPDNTLKSTYLYAGPQLLKEEPSTTDRSLDLYILHEGKVGSITHTVDMNGSVRNEYDYDTFGTRTHVKTANTGSNQHFGYTGQMQDAESGLLYLRARYYDPAIGRFISADPYLGRMAEPVTQNRYIYVHNNPLLYSDPSGNCPNCITGFFGEKNLEKLGGQILT